MCRKLNVNLDIMGTAFTLLHYYLKVNSFTDIDRIALASVCVNLACKIDYQHISTDKVVEQYYHHMKPTGIGLSVKKVKNIEDVGKEIMAEFATIEVKLLTLIEFDMEFDLPVKCVKDFKEQYLNSLFLTLAGDKDKDRAHYKAIDEMIGKFVDITLKLVRDQYQRPFCLYFPAPIIFSACLLLANVLLNKATVTFSLCPDSNITRVEDLLRLRFGKKSLMDIDAVSAQSRDDYWRDENVTVETASKINSEWLQKVLPKGSTFKLEMIDVLYLAVQIKKTLCFKLIIR